MFHQWTIVAVPWRIPNNLFHSNCINDKSHVITVAEDICRPDDEHKRTAVSQTNSRAKRAAVGCRHTLGRARGLLFKE